MKKLYRMVALALAAAALCFSLTGCGISDFFKNKDNKTQDDPNASPSAASTTTPKAATPVPEVSATPEATKEPVKVEIFYENKAVTELSFQTPPAVRPHRSSGCISPPPEPPRRRPQCRAAGLRR